MDIEVDPHLLHAGADMTHDAGRHVGAGADDFAAARLPPGMFGDFAAAAEGFHSTMTSHHGDHVTLMRQHEQVLTAVGEKAHAAARAFVHTDEHSAESLRAVGDSAL